MEPDLELISKLFPNLSAQLRTALQSLHLAAAQLIPAAQREQDADLDARAALLDQSYYRLLRLVNELSAAGWFAPGKQLRLRNDDLIALVQRVFANTESLAQVLGLELRLICPKAQHLCALDAAAMEQLLYQLLSNALKFTAPGGSVTLEVRFTQKSIQLLVTDTGCGIPAEQLDSLFSRCLEESEQLPVPPAGLGLGLMIARRIAQLHGGSLSAVSTVGEGTTLTLTLPDHLVHQIGLADVPQVYTGGFNPALMNLADALPVSAFRLCNQ